MLFDLHLFVSAETICCAACFWRIYRHLHTCMESALTISAFIPFFLNSRQMSKPKRDFPTPVGPMMNTTFGGVSAHSSGAIAGVFEAKKGNLPRKVGKRSDLDGEREEEVPKIEEMKPVLPRAIPAA